MLALVVSLLIALLLTDRNQTVDVELAVNDVAPHDVRATTDLNFTDDDASTRRRLQAVDQVAPVFDHDTSEGIRIQQRFADAFERARLKQSKILSPIAPEGPGDEAAETRRQRSEELAELAVAFCADLGVSLDAEERRLMVEDGFSTDLERVTDELVGRSMRRYILNDRAQLGRAPLPLSVIRILEGGETVEIQLDSLSDVRTLEEARQEISLYAVERIEGSEHGARIRVAAALARASLRANFSYNQLLTEERRQEAAQAVLPVVLHYPQGTVLLRQGDVVNLQHVALIEALRESTTEQRPWLRVTSLSLFSFLLCVIVYNFARTYIKKFARDPKELVAAAALLVAALALARGVVEIAGPLSQLHPAIQPDSIWLLTPVAGFAIIVRILMNSETCLIFSILAAVLCGFLMGESVLLVSFFLLSSITAAGAIGKDRKRRTILWAGVVTGLVNVGFILLMGLVQAHQSDLGAPPTPFWDATFAFTGGLLAGVLALGLIPLFELFGFVTDLQLLELANLDHPLLRNLMLRAPGTYHHSIIVGTLAEAASEAIGCNALLARVCCYFHDIGKTIKPKYFTENQRDGLNPHDKLPGHMSAQLIIDHVRNGGAIARQHNLPQPIVHAIYTHHGTGMLKHFYAKARAENPEVNEADFRYPGPKPDSREMGIIMLADKTEAACRSIKDPTPERISAMIQTIINSTIQDGQFDECPLTVKEIFIVAQSFEQVLLGIYHHRVEYPDTASISSGKGPQEPPREAVITLEIPTNEVRLTENLAAPTPAPSTPSPDPISDPDSLSEPGEQRPAPEAQPQEPGALSAEPPSDQAQ